MNFVNRIAETVGTRGNWWGNVMARIALQPASALGRTGSLVAPRATKNIKTLPSGGVFCLWEQNVGVSDSWTDHVISAVRQRRGHV